MNAGAFRRTSSRSTKPRTSPRAPESASSLAFSRVLCRERATPRRWRYKGPLRACGPQRPDRSVVPALYGPGALRPDRLRALLTHLLPSSLVPRPSVQSAPRPLARGGVARRSSRCRALWLADGSAPRRHTGGAFAGGVPGVITGTRVRSTRFDVGERPCPGNVLVCVAQARCKRDGGHAATMRSRQGRARPTQTGPRA